MKRRELLMAAGSALASPLPPASRAQAGWPDRPIRLIVPFPPVGGDT